MKLSLSVVGIAVLSGCTTTSNMAVDDLNYFQIDCNRREEQLAFLRRQMPTQDDRLVNGLRMTSPVGLVATMVDGTYKEERATFDRKQEAIARVIIHQIESYCPRPKPRPQGCVTVTEQMPSGNSQGTRCYYSNNPNARTNRWEALVD